MLNAAYADGLLSEETFAHRLEQVFSERLIDPRRLIGDLNLRGSSARRPLRLRAGVEATVRWFRPGPVPDPEVLLALDWNGDQDELLLGRHSGCDVVLGSGAVSRHHARLVFRDGSWVLFDLDSTNGTTVNGVRVGRCRLVPGDRVTLGDTAVRID